VKKPAGDQLDGVNMPNQSEAESKLAKIRQRILLYGRRQKADLASFELARQTLDDIWGILTKAHGQKKPGE